MHPSTEHLLTSARQSVQAAPQSLRAEHYLRWLQTQIIHDDPSLRFVEAARTTAYHYLDEYAAVRADRRDGMATTECMREAHNELIAAVDILARLLRDCRHIDDEEYID